ncbi:DUF4124 domain-containing protein [Agitococcus lubricus]|uniref:Uncharacterized protein DUF4124 n=1 Tax=Agitococcus lubricus TaxID=1077255 RepID=A0A2T5IZK2_9GAMM|nr:DUF4124 domain-containing protein [Agitococcus lubricus]PTQ89386.1 uncharacterized protein DUF4124 [Agitococcus lubricus]
MTMTRVDAENIYQWKDEAGKIHFGDRSSAPTQSKEVHVDTPTNIVSPQQPTRYMKKSLSVPYHAPALKAPNREIDPNLMSYTTNSGSAIEQTCLLEAMSMILNRDALSLEAFKAKSQGLLKRCPNKAYVCETYKRNASKNHCSVVDTTVDEQFLTKYKVYN